MKYDDASWHYAGDFPDNLPEEAGATHIGMFLTWALINDIAGELHLDASRESINKVKNHEMTGSEFLLKECDGKFTNEDLNDEGNSFTQHYFGDGDGYGKYINDYQEALSSGLPSMYHVEDSWENFSTLKPLLDKAYQEWKSVGKSIK